MVVLFSGQFVGSCGSHANDVDGQWVKNRFSDNVGGVKHFLSTLPHPLEEERHFALSEKQLPLPTKARS
jgi:hypothetical protein